MAQDEKTIYVYENWRGETPTLMGRLRCSFIRGQETFSFEYDPAWLTSARVPSLWTRIWPLPGTAVCAAGQAALRLFADSCPGPLGGRLLMRRKEH